MGTPGSRPGARSGRRTMDARAGARAMKRFRIRRRLRREAAAQGPARLSKLGRMLARIPAARVWAEAHTDSPSAAVALLGRCTLLGGAGMVALATSTKG